MGWVARAGWLVCLALLCLSPACGPGPEPDPAQLALDRARQAWLAGDYALAEQRYQCYLQDVKTGPDRLEAWKRLADIALDVWNNPANGLTLLEAAMLEAGPDSPEQPSLLRRAVEAALSANNPAKALELLDVLDWRPLAAEDRVFVPLRREQAMRRRHDLAGAIAVLEACRRADLPTSATAPCAARLAALHTELGRPESAVPVWQALLDDGTIDATIRAQAGFALAEAAEARNDKATARALYERIRDWHPNPKVVQRKLEYIGK